MTGAVLGLAVAAAAMGAVRPQSYYVDCGHGDDSNPGVSESAPWKSLAQASARVLAPGDSLLLRRGSVCFGTLRPQGSGSAGAPVTVGAYGVGPRPRVEAGRNEEAFKLFNQEYWNVESLELSGGATYGILIGGDRPAALRGIRFKDLSVHDVIGPVSRKESGLIVVQGSDGASFEDLLVDGVEAYNTSQWAGILVISSTRAVVRNSIVHDVAGDGIALFHAADGLLENNVAWHTGLQGSETIGTPNAIWTWKCRGCVVRDNEAFLTDSPGVDGGAFDIDCGNTDNAVIGNYGHDTEGYCAAVFGCDGMTTKNSVVRGNVCARNGLSPRLARRQGALFIYTWRGGSLEGVSIESNTIDWAPSGNVPMVVDDAHVLGAKVSFRGNRLSADSPQMLYLSTAVLEIDGDRYVERSDASGADQGPMFEPTALKDLEGRPISPVFGAWTLYSFLKTSADGVLEDASRKQMVVLTSLREQFHSKGLRVVTASGGAPRTMLVSPAGKVVRQWPVFSGPAKLGFEVRRWLGEPNCSSLSMIRGPI